MKLRELFSTIRLDTAAALRGLKTFDEELDNSSEGLSDVEKRSKTVENAFRSIGKAGVEGGKMLASGLAVGFGAVQGVALATTAFVADWTGGVNEIAKASKQLSIPFDELQRIKAVAEAAGLELEDGLDFVKDFGVKIAEALADPAGDANQALVQLGLSAKDLVDQRPIDQMKSYADALQRVENRTIRTEIADRLASDAAVRMGAAFTEGSEGIQRTIDTAEELGVFLGEDAFQAAEEFSGSVRTLNAVLTGFRNEIGLRLTPVITRQIERIGKWAGKNRELVAVKVSEWLERIIRLAEQSIPGLIEIAESIGGVIESVGGIDDALILAGEAFIAFKLVALASVNPIAAAIGGVLLGLGEVIRLSRKAREERVAAENEARSFSGSTLVEDLTAAELATPEGQRLKQAQEKADRITAALKATQRAEDLKNASEAVSNDIADEFAFENGPIVDNRKELEAERERVLALQEQAKRAQDEATAARKAFEDERARQARIAGKAAREAQEKKDAADKEARDRQAFEFQRLIARFNAGDKTLTAKDRQTAVDLGNRLGLEIPAALIEKAFPKGSGGSKKKKEPTIEELIFGPEGKLDLQSAQAKGPGTTLINVDASIRVEAPQLTLNITTEGETSPKAVAREIQTTAASGFLDQLRAAFEAQVRQVQG